MSPGQRILVAEDSETQSLQLRLLFEEAGLEVTCVANAEAALLELARNCPDLLVVDYYLPGMSGGELCRQLRKNDVFRSLPVLLLTAHESEAMAAASGADDFLSKSEKKSVLIEHVEALLRKTIEGRAPGFRGGRLLAIDDSRTHLEHLSVTLGNQGYEVDKALSGAEGLRKIATTRFDCVLVDLIMPDMDGIEVCRRITSMRQTLENPLPVIIVTSRETGEDMTRGLEAGADDFVSKSSDLTVLQARIRALLRREFVQQENRRMVEELKTKEMEAVRARAQQEATEVRASAAGILSQANRDLEEANTRLKATQVHLIHTEKMVSLGQLVAGIAHEINNPLGFVLNHLFTVRTALDTLDPELKGHMSEAAFAKLQKARLRLEQMGQGLDRIKDLVLNLRTFSRQDEGDFKAVNIHESIDSVLLFLQHKMNGRIRLEKEYGLQNLLACHAGQLNQVFMNLVSNAIDAIEGEGTIQIATSQNEEMALISVRDSGGGIPQEIRNRIFEPFFTTKPVGEGTGLGLAISYGIVQAHEGVIEVESQAGEGTEFTVKIPLHLKDKKAL